MDALITSDLQASIVDLEVAGAQARFIGDDWVTCSVEHHNLVQSNPSEWPGYETRLVYALRRN